jgi:hypothetical protein
MEDADQPTVEEPGRVRWVPSVLLDLSPAEPVTALRTPHRIMLQGLPATREGLAALLGRTPFELSLDLESDTAPLRHVPIVEVHEARLTPELPLDWGVYYWLADGLLDDLADQPADPAAGFVRGRLRLAVAEQHRREALRSEPIDLADLDAAWETPRPLPVPDTERWGEPSQALMQYVRGLTGHLAEHASSRPFVDAVRALVDQDEQRAEPALPNLGAADIRTLWLYAQHRLFGSPHLAAPAGMIAGWHLLFSAHVVAVWWAGILAGNRRGALLAEALQRSLFLLDQGLWRDEPLVHDLLRHLNASEYTSLGLAASLAAALRGTTIRA